MSGIGGEGKGSKEKTPGVRVCYFGTYECDYPRNKVFITGLRSAGVQVVEYHVPVWERYVHKVGSFLAPRSLAGVFLRVCWAHLLLFFKFLTGEVFARRPRGGPRSVVMVGFVGQFDLHLAWFLSRLTRRPLIFNPLVSLYDTAVGDRQLYTRGSPVAAFCRLFDRISCRLSDLVILDTAAHARFFGQEFGLDERKLGVIFVGADEGIFSRTPSRERDGALRVFFMGKFTPLHGLDTILAAAQRLREERDIEFEIVGTGQLYESITHQAREVGVSNVSFPGWMDLESIARRMAQSDVCLGIFGTSMKAQRVIPNKVFQALAMQRAVITGDSAASRELLQDGENALLIPMGDAQSLASAILRLRDDSELRTRIAEAGYQTYRSQLATSELGKQIRQYAEQLLATEDVH